MYRKILALFPVLILVTLLVSVSAQSSEQPTLVVDTLGGILREAPNFSAEQITKIAAVSVTIIGISPDERYFLVEYEGQQGWISTTFGRVEGDSSTVSILDPDTGDILEAEETAEPCFISTDEAQTAGVRVGPGENRTSLTFLKVATEYEVAGQNVDDVGETWFALEKEIGAPRKSVIDPYVWVAIEHVTTEGDCDTVNIVTASGPRPFATATPVPEKTIDNDDQPEATITEEPTAPPVPRARGTFYMLLDQNIMPCPIIQPYGKDINVAIGSGYPTVEAAQAALNAQTTSISIDGQPMPTTRSGVGGPTNGLFSFSTDYFWKRPLPGTYEVVGIEPNAVRNCTVIIEG